MTSAPLGNPPPAALPRPQLRRRLGLALIAAPVAIQALTVALLSVNTVLWDEFFYVPFVRAVREGRSWWPYLVLQHNEHRLVPTKLVIGVVGALTDWDTRVEMYVSVALAGLAILGLWHLYRRLGGSDLLLFAPVAWLVCSLGQYENMLYGIMTCWYFMLVGVVWALVLLTGGGALAIAGAAACALMASFSILNGLLLWPLGLAVLLLRRRWRAAAAWLAISAGAVALYFHGFQMPGGQPPLPPFGVASIVHIGQFGIKLLGATLAGGSIAWGAVVGLILASATAMVAFRWLRSIERLRRDAPAAALIVFAALSSAMIAAGRAAFQGMPPLQPRYMIVTMLVVIGLYLLLVRDVERAEPRSRPHFLLAAVLALLLPGLLAASVEGVRAALDWREWQLQEKVTLQTFDRQPLESLRIVYNPEEVAPGATYLRAHKLGPFADPVGLLLLTTRWQEGIPGDEILPGRPIEQTLVCPVGEIHDIGVVFATYGRTNASHVAMSLWENGRLLGSHDLAAADLRDSGWGKFPVHVPQCQGRRLLLRVASTDARTGDAVTAWTYPNYYEGEVSQPGNSRIAGRSLGLAINGFTARLLKE